MGKGDTAGAACIDLSGWIPVFPLPNAVLLPRAVLPLHVFEDRYRSMTQDTLAGNRLMCVALLKPGYEAKYHTLCASIHPVVGVGRILKEECLPDGRFNFLLQGLIRARVVEENRELSYRRAHLEKLCSEVNCCDLEKILRLDIRMLLREGPLQEIAQQAHWMELIACPDLKLSDLLDILASALLTCPEEKQEFLSQTNVMSRGQIIRERLKSLSQECTNQPVAKRSRNWPPGCCDN